MADIGRRYGDNVAGLFYVDSSCIDCDACRENAPHNFTRNEENGYSYVYKQPETKEELAMCEDALEGCPAEAIGKIEEQIQPIITGNSVQENVS